MKDLIRSGALAAAFGLLSGSAYAADAATAQPTNWNAILIFLAFVIVTLGITYWAAQRTRTTKDFYAAGGGDHRLPERPGDRRRLYVGGLVPRHRRRWSTASATTA